MDDEKPGSSFKNFEEREQQNWTAIVENFQSSPRPGYEEALLIRGNERLKRVVKANLKAVEKLRASTEESSREANRLASAIKKLTAWLVALTAAAVALAALSLYVLFSSAK